FPAVEPVLAMLERAVRDAGRTRGAGRLLMTLEVQHGGEQRQAALALEAQVADAARQRRLEPEPGLDGAIDLGRLLDHRPGTRPDPRGGRVKHRADRAGALHRLDVPGERDEVAPVAFIME